MPRILRNLRIDDVSSVDVGAGRGVRVVLTKRDGSRLVMRKHRDGVSHLYGKPLEFGADLDEGTLEYLKRDVSDKEREQLAGEGKALPDGSFPIANVSDLKNAIRAIGRAKDPAKAKAHIKARAKDLGQSDLIPDTWEKRLTKQAAKLIGEANALRDVSKAAKDFDAAIGGMDAAEQASDLMCGVRDAMCALDCAFQSIMMDDDVDDKAAAIQESYDQFEQYIDDLDLPDEPDTDEGTSKRNDDMTSVTALTTAAVQKMIDDAVAKAAAEKDDRIAKLENELVISKMTDKQRQYFGSMSDEDEKKKFKSMSSDERDAYMNKMEKRLEDDPVVKGLVAQIADLQKRLQAQDDEKDLRIAKADVAKLGLTQTDAGEVLMKVRRGDKDAIKKYEGYVEEMAKSRKAFEKSSRAFEELGHTGAGEGTGASAMDQLAAKAAELRQKDPNLTEAQAFDKAYNDPANRELRDLEARERMTKIHRVA